MSYCLHFVEDEKCLSLGTSSHHGGKGPNCQPSECWRADLPTETYPNHILHGVKSHNVWYIELPPLWCPGSLLLAAHSLYSAIFMLFYIKHEKGSPCNALYWKPVIYVRGLSLTNWCCPLIAERSHLRTRLKSHSLDLRGKTRHPQSSSTKPLEPVSHMLVEEVINECRLLQIVRQSPAKCDDPILPWSLRVTYQRNLTNQYHLSLNLQLNKWSRWQ